MIQPAAGQNGARLPDDGFPYQCSVTMLRRGRVTAIPWNWHVCLCVILVEKGHLLLRTTQNFVELSEGEAVYISPNMLYLLRLPDMAEECTFYLQLFDMQLLCGQYGSIFEQKYMMPIIRRRDLTYHCIRPDSDSHIQMLVALRHGIGLAEMEPFGFEFGIREYLSRFWAYFYKDIEDSGLLRDADEFAENPGSPRGYKNLPDIERMKLMLEFVHTNYREKITVQQIADSAGVSMRECSRCFQRNIGLSPVVYLNRYRLRISARELIQTTDPIAMIGERNGFSDPSYYTRMFRELVGCTPKEYRGLSVAAKP